MPLRELQPFRCIGNSRILLNQLFDTRQALRLLSKFEFCGERLICRNLRYLLSGVFPDQLPGGFFCIRSRIFPVGPDRLW